MKCPVSGADCSPKEIFEVHVVMANEKGPVAEGPVRNKKTGQNQLVCQKCQENLEFEDLIDEDTFVKIQHKYRQMGQDIPRINDCSITFKKIGSVM